MLDGERPLRAYLEPIADALADPRTKEIVIQRPGEVGIETHGWEWREVPEFTLDRLDQIGILTAYIAGQEFDEEHPILRASLPDGERFTACRQPVSGRGTMAIDIRVPTRTKRSVFDDDLREMTKHTNEPRTRRAVVRQELIKLYRAQQWPEFLDLGVRHKLNFIGTGVTGSGKTSLLQRLLSSIPSGERIVTIQDANEWGPSDHRNRVDFYYGGAGVTALDTVLISLRMRPDRALMQECRGQEAYGFYEILTRGWGGNMTTIHCDMGDEPAFDVLETMIKSHPNGSSIAGLRKRLRSLVDVIVWCDRDLEDDKFELPYVWFRDAEEPAT